MELLIFLYSRYVFREEFHGWRELEGDNQERYIIRKKKKKKMREDSREGYNYKAKQEGATMNNNNIDRFSKVPSSRQWPGFRNPRIVRVSRSFGGKDRHSKVCTIRGLRDRRIRLSVPTAVQLYDLQDRLGLSQPSKVIDWLLEATKYDIDKLPPLQIPHGFPQFHHHPSQTLLHHEPAISLHSSLGLGSVFEKGKWVKASQEEEEEEEEEEENGDNANNNNSNNGFGEIPLFHQKHFLSQYFNGIPGNYNPYHNLEPSSLSLSQFGSHGSVFPSQTEFGNTQSSSSNGVQFSSSSCLPPPPPATVVPSPSSGYSKLLFCPSSSSSSSTTTTSASAAAATVPSFFSSHQIATSAEDSDPRGQFNSHVHQLLSSSQSSHFPHHISFLKPLPVPLLSSKLLDSSDHNNQPNKGSNL